MLTVNTDFADAEVDERQVNLGRFSLFFPEKRSFFTQDATLFTFGGIQQNPLPFFSRRIGLADDGRKADLLGGLKLTGRAGPWTLGLLDVQTDGHNGVESKNLLVGRIAHQVFDESSAGLIFTRGDPRLNGNASLVGVDFNYVNSHVVGRKVLTARAAVQATATDHAGGRGTATTLNLDFPNDPLAVVINFSRIDPKYDPALGFVPRTGISEYHPTVRYRWYPDRRGLHRIDLFTEAVLVTELGGRRLDRTLYPGFEFENSLGDGLTAWVEDRRERLDTAFAIRPGIVIPVRDYSWTDLHARYQTTRARPLNFTLQWGQGGFYGGWRSDYEVEFGWRPSRHLELVTSYKLRGIRLPLGNFAVRIGEAKAVYTFSPDLQFSLLAQYDNFSAELGVNLRVKWTVKPGNEMFFIINQGYDTSADNFRPTQNDVSLKGAWTFRF